MALIDFFAGRAGYGQLPDSRLVSGAVDAIGTSDIVLPQGTEIWHDPVPYPWGAAPSVVSVVSDSANDTALGTGCQSVLIDGLDIDGFMVSEIIATNGTAPVNTSSVYSAVNYIYVIVCGTGQRNEGTFTASLSGTAVEYIAAGKGRSLGAHFKIPADWKGGAVLSQVWATVADQQSSTAVFQIKSKPNGIGWQAYGEFSATSGFGIVTFAPQAIARFRPLEQISICVTEINDQEIKLSGGFDLIRILDQDFPRLTDPPG